MSVHVVHICGKFSESPMKAPCLTWSCALSRAHRARPVRSGAALREQAEGAVLARTWPKPPQLNGAAVVRKSSSCRQTGSSCSSFVARTSSLSSSTGAAAAAARKAKLADVAALVLEVPLRFGMDFQRSALPPWGSARRVRRPLLRTTELSIGGRSVAGLVILLPIGMLRG